MERTCELLPMADLEAAADCLRVMAHPVRLRIVDILMQADLPVHEIAALCDLPPHQTCEHLRLLKGHGLLDSVRRGRAVFYRISNPQLPMLLRCVRTTCGKTIGTSPDEQTAGQ
jgi:ArsR family transcriptional regulator, zinc-responsive transcriptional repressor